MTIRRLTEMGMILENERCHIKIETDTTYTVDSVDNRHYDLVLNPGQYRRNDFTKTFAIEINLFSKGFTIALIGPFYSYDTDCAVLEDGVLTVLQNDTITQISIEDGSVIRYTKFDCFGCNFAIYKVQAGYIIYGEIEIAMLDFDLHKKWSFSGKDIFVSLSDRTPFEICQDSIRLYDFEGNFYRIDYNGNLIESSLSNQ